MYFFSVLELSVAELTSGSVGEQSRPTLSTLSGAQRVRSQPKGKIAEGRTLSV